MEMGLEYMCGLNYTFFPEVHLVFTLCAVSPLVILIQFQKDISPFMSACLDNLSLTTLTSKCLLFFPSE